MFGRKKRTGSRDGVVPSGESNAAAETAGTASAEQAQENPRALGPRDESELPGERSEYLDLGALLVKPISGVDVRLEVDQRTQEPRAVNLDFRDGSVQLQPFSAPKSSGLWEEVRAELIAGLRRDNGDPSVTRGSFGLQVDAKFAATTADGRQGYRLARFVGIDGPRWFLRAVFTGGAALPGPTAEVLDDAVRALVVVRGQDPRPPRDLLTLSVPEDATVRRMADSAGQPPAPVADADGVAPRGGDGAPSGPAVQPPRRGPEITEIG
ncbi:MAG: DUF3710 domain-containing protein [Kocuria sp.]|uniref:DUF3710 domain-containing protein n=1 Tax=Kocuria sp. TaxID=1871328 RepID=UPI0026DAAFAC|nr:DUF3710 domain-containing protein [Kocuria sp.]MDO4256455.1 DUF3710 domain-containing protein [Kocuria sp.]